MQATPEYEPLVAVTPVTVLAMVMFPQRESPPAPMPAEYHFPPVAVTVAVPEIVMLPQ